MKQEKGVPSASSAMLHGLNKEIFERKKVIHTKKRKKALEFIKNQCCLGDQTKETPRFIPLGIGNLSIPAPGLYGVSEGNLVCIPTVFVLSKPLSVKVVHYGKWLVHYSWSISEQGSQSIE